jgi:hypothetical protein
VPWVRLGPFLVTPTLFAVWVFAFLRGRPVVPRTSIAAFFLLVAGSLVWSVVGWSPTVAFYGTARAVPLLVQCLAPPAAIGVVARLKPPTTPNQSLLLHWCTFAWLSWSAFPWYGELL